VRAMGRVPRRDGLCRIVERARPAGAGGVSRAAYGAQASGASRSGVVIASCGVRPRGG
jgi:hypothetical protein